MADVAQLPGNAAVGYFVDHKKGEVNELKQLLKNINVERDVKRKRDIIKKVIAYMTLGIDVSRLFTDMIMAIETRDIVIKKMVYLYLCNYANKETEMAIMCINSLRRDCDNEDPLVRGLALRSLCSLRMESILEYVQQPLQKSLQDISAYVRKTGVMGMLKLHELSPALFESGGYMEKLRGMLQDVDASVVTNVIYVINELDKHKGGLEVDQALVMMLLNRIGEFSEWGLGTVLDMVSRYQPTSEDETYAIMNLLDPVLRTANSGAVLATFKCFISLTVNMPELHRQIIERSKPPMLTLVTGAHPEGQYCMLKHLETLLRLPVAKGIFDEDFRQFFVRYNETSNVKHLKVDLLPLIANQANAGEIAAELGEYVTDVDAELAKRAIRALGEICMTIPAVCEEMAQQLLQLVDMDSSYVRSEAAKVLTNVVRVRPHLSSYVLPYLSKIIKRIDDAAAKAALVWLLGECGHDIEEAPYLLETIIDAYDEEPSVAVKLQVLSSSMKLFFKRAPEMQAMLGKLFVSALNDTSNQDLHDRSLLYYRLLSTDMGSAAEVFQSGMSAAAINGVFAESMDLERRKKLFQEFNSLAIVFSMPSAQFIDDKYQMKIANIPLAAFDGTASVTAVPNSAAAAPGSVNADSAALIGLDSTPAAPAAVAPSAGATTGSVNLLDWDDLGLAPPEPQPAPVAAAPAPVGLSLIDSAGQITPAAFQQQWGQLGDAFNGHICHIGALPPMASAATDIENAFRNAKITVLASGALPPGGPQGLKMFLYAIEDMTVGGATHLAQLLLLYDSREVTVTTKTNTTSANATDSARLFTNSIVSALSPFSPQP